MGLGRRILGASRGVGTYFRLARGGVRRPTEWSRATSGPRQPSTGGEPRPQSPTGTVVPSVERSSRGRNGPKEQGRRRRWERDYVGQPGPDLEADRSPKSPRSGRYRRGPSRVRGTDRRASSSRSSCRHPVLLGHRGPGVPLDDSRESGWRDTGDLSPSDGRFGDPPSLLGLKPHGPGEF